MLYSTWIHVIRRLVLITCVFAVACITGYLYYLWPADQNVVSRVQVKRNSITGILSVFMSAQLNDSFSELSLSASPSGTIDASSNHGVLLNASKPVRGVKYLSYQPPGNGWNNHRVTLENAVVLAKLLNRTLVVHPMAPHDKGALFKAGAQPGYIAYNHLKQSDLVPYLFSLTSSYCLSSFLYKKWLHHIINFIMTLAS